MNELELFRRVKTAKVMITDINDIGVDFIDMSDQQAILRVNISNSAV